MARTHLGRSHDMWQHLGGSMDPLSCLRYCSTLLGNMSLALMELSA